MTRIRTIGEKEATGKLKSVYERISARRGGVADLLKAQSLMPQTVEDHFNLYKTLMFETRETGISRRLLETAAVAVSVANRCEYCINHHSVPLMKLVKNENIVKALRDEDNQQLSALLPGKELLVVQLARTVTREPWKLTDDHIAKLEEAGYDHRQILHLILVINYFNFVNRNVLALGVELEEDFEKTCI